MPTTHQLFTNNAASTLNGTLAIGGSFFNVAVGHGSRFPTPSSGEYFHVTLFELDAGGNEINYEIARVNSVSGDTFAVVRDAEGVVVAGGGTSGGWAYPSAPGVNPSQVVYVELRHTAFAAENNLTKDGNLEGLESAATARGNLGLGSMATQEAGVVAITGGTISGTTMTGNTMEATDSLSTFADNADPTKKIRFELAGVTSGQTRIITIPDTNFTPAQAGNVPADTNAAASKATPVDADAVPLVDSEALNGLKKLTWANIKATLKIYLDTLYAAIGHAHTGTYEPADANLVKKNVANTFAATQVPDNGTDTISATGTYTFDGTDQIREITCTNAAAITMGEPTGITAKAMYKLIFKAGDTSARSIVWNAAFKMPNGTAPFSSLCTTSGGYDTITFIGAAGNVLIYDGHTADAR